MMLRFGLLTLLLLLVADRTIFPVAYAQEATATANKHGSGWLGVRLSDIQKTTEDIQMGVRIESVFAGSPALNAGFLAGDAILAVDGKTVSSVSELIATIKGKSPNADVKIKRQSSTGEIEIVSVRLAERPDSRQMVTGLYLNKVAPDLDLVSVADGRRMSLESYAGQVVLLDFWATWCGPCIKSMPKVQALFDKYRNRGLSVIGVSMEKPAKVKAFLKRRPVNYEMALVPKNAKNVYLITNYPTMMIIDKRGVIHDVQIGAGNIEDLEKRIVSLL